MTDPLLISQSEFAKSIGVSRQAVSKAVQEGRIQLFLDHTDGKMKLNKDLASKQWRESTQPRIENSKVQNTFRPQVAMPPKTKPGDQPIDPFDDDEEDSDYYGAKTETEKIKTQLLDLELKQKLGELVSADQVKKEGFKLGRVLRDSILNVPSMICNELAVESDPFIIHQKMTAALTKALESLVAEAQDKYEEVMEGEDESDQED